MMRRLMPTPLKDIPLTAKEQKDFEQKMLQPVALGNLPFSFVELAPLQAALQKLRPSVELPSRRALGGRILNDAAAAADAEADAELRRSKHLLEAAAALSARVDAPDAPAVRLPGALCVCGAALV